MPNVDDLRDRVSERLGREVETEFIRGKGYQVIYLNVALRVPRPTGKTEEEALENFIAWYDQNHTSREV